MQGSVASSDAGGVLTRALPSPAACVVEPLSNGIPLLLWVRSGTMHADVAGQAHVVTAGRGLWVPAGVEHSLNVADGGVVVPVLLMITDPPPLLDAVAELDVPPAWGDWLLQQFARTQGYLCASAGDLGELLDGADAVTPHDGEAGSGTDAGTNAGAGGGALRRREAPARVSPVAPPPWPTSAETRAVAEHLAAHPRDLGTIAELAARVGVSARTLERRFRAETGHGPAAWHLHMRLARAARLVAEGRALGWVAHDCGFETSSGFSRAFSRHTGHAPSDYARAVLAHGDGVASEHLAHLATRVDDTAPPPIAATRTWPRINDFDVVVWLYRGSATVHAGDRVWHLVSGDAMLLPAGVPNIIDVDADSLLLPLGAGVPRGLRLGEMDVVHLPAEADDHLLHLVIAAQTLIRAPGYDPQQVVDAFHRMAREGAGGIEPALSAPGAPGAPGRGVSASLSSEPTPPTGRPVLVRMAKLLHRRPADPRSQAEWARQFGMSGVELGLLVRREAGCTFPVWRSQIRMSVAREMLDEGHAPSLVARRLGYAHLSGFSKLFSTAHGLSPREYQRRNP